ncbi:alpha-galactosidase [Myceligenerans sp. TRM 65318]|uniref:Alpha-galactosidase n=2 Tax=Myceligenerans pegani TaxID=2776917 RepID=A0ABR9MY77_9MICO|nr:alpha-galactosidase [Myceligenerans sp. TRM 65318]MBE3018602.1 alpha-galactosidase [Myceligenerans sp. TRM 65318]
MPKVEDARQGAGRAWPQHVRLAASGVAVVLSLPADALPAIVHWGADPGDLDDAGLAGLIASSVPALATNGVDDHVRVAVLPESWTGWTGTPGLEGHRSGRAWSPRFRPESVEVRYDDAGGGLVTTTASDDDAALRLVLEIELLASGILRLRAHLTNLGDDHYTVDALRLALPVPTSADELLDLAGRWAKERVPQRRALTVGTHLREGRHGRTGADAATLLVAGRHGFDFDRGEVWGVHVAFSGNHQVAAERTFDGRRLLLGGELLLPGEIELDPGQTYSSPRLYAGHGVGLDELAARFHDHLRSRDRHPRSPRPVTMNVWEAVYFDHDLERLIALADRAAEAGVERYVLDDGWFGSRRDDSSGLGDWRIADEVWGGGRLERLVEHVRGLGMEFGLWFEPEMVNPDSELAAAHPEWLLQVPGRLPVEARRQQVLDLTHPGAFEHVRSSVSAVLGQLGVDFVKWDHNRDLVDAGSTRTGRAGVHAQTLAAYRLMDEIRAAHPRIEIEACSSGGARVDLEVLERTDRVWASDCIDARERQQIQRWTAQLLPPELVGSHVGADRAHTTGRRLDLSFRAATALFGHFGIEWDLTAAGPEERAELREWVGYYKRMRDLVHTGRVVRRSLEQGDLWLHGAVRPDRSEALYAVTVVERHVTWPPGPVRLPGLDPERTYVVRPSGPGVAEQTDPRVYPEWWGTGLRLPGAVLTSVGISVPALDPDHTALIHVEAAR